MITRKDRDPLPFSLRCGPSLWWRFPGGRAHGHQGLQQQQLAREARIADYGAPDGTYLWHANHKVLQPRLRCPPTFERQKVWAGLGKKSTLVFGRKAIARQRLECCPFVVVRSCPVATPASRAGRERVRVLPPSASYITFVSIGTPPISNDFCVPRNTILLPSSFCNIRKNSLIFVAQQWSKLTRRRSYS